MPDPTDAAWGTPVDRFGLENGKSQLKPWFKKIQLLNYPNHLEVTEIEPILDYIQSYQDEKISEEDLISFRTFLKAQIKDKGNIQITKESGLFVVVKH